MKNSKKSFVVATLLVACFVFLGTGIQSVKAVTLDELQAQIDALMAQIAELQKQKAELQSGDQDWCHIFDINLKYGDQNSETQALETALQKQGYSLTEHSSNFMARFDEKMAAAVVGFQEKYKQDILGPYNLQHGTGYVGPTTRTKLNELYGCQAATGCDARNISVWDWDYCTPECPCDAGEGDCDKDSDSNYGQTSSMDVCEVKETISTPIITSSYPTSGKVGTLVTVYGKNFTQLSTVSLGNNGIETEFVNSKKLTFVMPELYLDPGNYDLKVVNVGDIETYYSNILEFEIISDITGCDARNISVWDWDYCTPECPCDAGEGDCDKDSDSRRKKKNLLL